MTVPVTIGTLAIFPCTSARWGKSCKKVPSTTTSQNAWSDVPTEFCRSAESMSRIHCRTWSSGASEQFTAATKLSNTTCATGSSIRGRCWIEPDSAQTPWKRFSLFPPFPAVWRLLDTAPALRPRLDGREREFGGDVAEDVDSQNDPSRIPSKILDIFLNQIGRAHV